MPYTVKLPNGEFLTGRSWRKENALFINLPFTTNVVCMEENMGDAIHSILEGADINSRIRLALTRIGTGLDKHYPFNNTPAVELIVQNAGLILMPGTDQISRGYALAIWSLMSNFIALDRLCMTFGAATVAPSQPVLRTHCDQFAIGTALPFLLELTPPTKILNHFCVAWATRGRAEEQLGMTADIFDPFCDPSKIALTLSQHLVSRGKKKALMNMTSGLEMLALALTICRENEGVFPEKQSEFKECLIKLGSRTLVNKQIDFLATEAPVLFTGIQHLLHISFSISPILVLSAHSWHRYTVNSIYLCQVFHRLGNERPKSLILMEDYILSAAMKLSHGEDLWTTMSCLHDEIKASEDVLICDPKACNWFDLSIPTELLNRQPSQSKNTIGNEYTSGLASPPDTPKALPSTSAIPQLSCINPHLLQLCDLSLNEDVAMAEDTRILTKIQTQTEQDTKCQEPKAQSAWLDKLDVSDDRGMREVHEKDSIGRNANGRGDNEVKEAQEDVVKEVHREEGQESEQESEVNQRGMCMTANHHLNLDSNPSCKEGEGEKQRRQEEEDGREKDTMKEDAEGQDAVDVEDVEEEHRKYTMKEDAEESDVEEEHEDESDTAEEHGEESDTAEEHGEESDTAEEDTVEKNGEEEEDKKQENSEDTEHVKHLPILNLRRSTRLQMQTANPASSDENFATTQKQSGGNTRKSKPPRSRANLFDVDSPRDDERPKLRDIGQSTRHATISVDIAGWGSTYECGPKPFRHVPVHIVPPGDVESTGIDAETLQRLERQVQEGFIDGVPPHLLPSARSLTYAANSNQSRFFVTPHSEYISLTPETILGVLRKRHIIVHGHPFDHQYGWNLDSFARLYDVDKMTTVHAAHYTHPSSPEIRHFQGTLRDLFEITTTFPTDGCPPLNAISLPAGFRNLVTPSKWECIASHELAQSRVPASYTTLFNVSSVREKTEWSLIGGTDVISPLHIDDGGFVTVVLILEGGKYWIIGTRVGDTEDICSVDSLGPNWNPYVINEGNNVNRFRFEAVHLQKGDMIIMRPGTLHWVLGTANTICAGRHFYASSTIMPSIISHVHTSLLAGRLSNENKSETQTLLYQMMHFWSMRINKRDVDGAHIPDISSPVQFFDVVYLGLFIILSRAFNPRFYSTQTPQALDDEIASAEAHFVSLMHYFSEHYITVLDSLMIDPWYIIKRLLAEFAAAAIIFSQGIDGFQSEDMDMDVDALENEGEEISPSKLKAKVDEIFAQSYPEVMRYYLQCVATGHKHFTWTGPPITILPRSEACDSILGLLIPEGEKLDHPTCPIFLPETTLPPPSPATSNPSLPDTTTQSSGVDRKGKRRASNGEGVISKRVKQ